MSKINKEPKKYIKMESGILGHISSTNTEFLTFTKKRNNNFTIIRIKNIKKNG